MNFAIDLDAQYLPSRLVRKETIRFGRPGTAKAKISAQYVNQQNGELFQTKAQLQCHLGNKLDLSIMDFKTGKLSQYLLKKNIKKSKTKLMQPPIRPSHLIKMKVNTLKTQPNSKVNNEIKAPMNAIKPKQVFWEKRLSQYKTADDKLKLPKNIRQFGPEVDNSTAVRSIAAALQLHSNLGIVGQTDSKVADKNPSVFINPDQPLVHALVITDDDVRKQEERVLGARKKLSMAYK